MSYLDDHKTVAQHFTGYFTADKYDGSYSTLFALRISRDFNRLVGHVNWSQVHGDFKDVVKRKLFKPYPHWTELYTCCQEVIRGNEELGLYFYGKATQAKMMGEVMALMRAKHGLNTPRWWLPIMNDLRQSGRE